MTRDRSHKVHTRIPVGPKHAMQNFPLCLALALVDAGARRWKPELAVGSGRMVKTDEQSALGAKACVHASICT